MAKIPYKEIIKYYLRANRVKPAQGSLVEHLKKLVTSIQSKSIFDSIEAQRVLLLNDHYSIPFLELGAGSHSSNGSQRKVSAVAKTSLSGPWQCQYIHSFCELIGAQQILELGTSLGISAAYLATVPDVHLITMEGNPSSIEVANRVFSTLGLSTIDIVSGNFDDTLLPTIKKYKNVDVVFIDGNHRKKATIEYFNILLNYAAAPKAIIIDDIYWSDGMHEAWQIIKNDSRVKCSVDLYKMGIVFIDEHFKDTGAFTFIHPKWKPL